MKTDEGGRGGMLGVKWDRRVDNEGTSSESDSSSEKLKGAVISSSESGRSIKAVVESIVSGPRSREGDLDLSKSVFDLGEWNMSSSSSLLDDLGLARVKEWSGIAVSRNQEEGQVGVVAQEI